MARNIVIVGAGFTGSVIAERLASKGFKVLIIDKRHHIAGNCYDELDENGVHVHRFAGHIFHTNNTKVVEYLSNFTEWRPYEHKVIASIEGKLVPIPINIDTINILYGLSLDETTIGAFFDSVIEKIDVVKTSKDVALSSIGIDLYEKFFKNYSINHWGVDPSDLDASVFSRIPVRKNYDDRYFDDSFQCMPSKGYSNLISNILDHPNITVELCTDFFKIKDSLKSNLLVYTGRIDEFYNFYLGKLPYRSLDFVFEHHANKEYILPCGTVNYPNDHAFNRIGEFKYMTGQKHKGTTTVKDYPNGHGDPYYPIPSPENKDLFLKYSALTPIDTIITGRLGQYEYMNMDKAVAAALSISESIMQ